MTEPVVELDEAGNVVARFVYSSKGHVPDYVIKGAVTYRVVSDPLESVRLVVKATDSSVVQKIDYDEFGNITNDTSPGFQPFAFVGGIYDQHTKLIRFGARDYDSFAGRWTSKDLIRFDGGQFNLYGYVMNSPINKVDLIGMNAMDVSDLVCSTEEPCKKEGYLDLPCFNKCVKEERQSNAACIVCMRFFYPANIVCVSACLNIINGICAKRCWKQRCE